MGERPKYLEPYDRAAARHGAGFGTLLWASPRTQAVRFEAMTRAIEFGGRRVLDVGCGRADLFDYLSGIGVRVEHYTGIEGVPALAEAARAKRRPNAQIVEADFVADPHRLFVGAQVVAISGALNTMAAAEFYATLRRAHEAASETLVFNFLSSPNLAGADHLNWHPPEEVLAFAGTLSPSVRVIDDYLQGDCTIALGNA